MVFIREISTMLKVYSCFSPVSRLRRNLDVVTYQTQIPHVGGLYFESVVTLDLGIGLVGLVARLCAISACFPNIVDRTSVWYVKWFVLNYVMIDLVRWGLSLINTQVVVRYFGIQWWNVLRTINHLRSLAFAGINVQTDCVPVESLNVFTGEIPMKNDRHLLLPITTEALFWRTCCYRWPMFEMLPNAKFMIGLDFHTCCCRDSYCLLKQHKN